MIYEDLAGTDITGTQQVDAHKINSRRLVDFMAAKSALQGEPGKPGRLMRSEIVEAAM